MKRNTEDVVIAGVCSGLAQEWGVDPILIRLAFVAAFLFWGMGPLVYLILWLLMPVK